MFTLWSASVAARPASRQRSVQRKLPLGWPHSAVPNLLTALVRIEVGTATLHDWTILVSVVRIMLGDRGDSVRGPGFLRGPPFVCSPFTIR